MKKIAILINDDHTMVRLEVVVFFVTYKQLLCTLNSVHSFEKVNP